MHENSPYSAYQWIVRTLLFLAYTEGRMKRYTALVELTLLPQFRISARLTKRSVLRHLRWESPLSAVSVTAIDKGK